jgi:hypothetical protein
MRFKYAQRWVQRPVVPHGGVLYRLRPVVSVIVSGPGGSRITDTLIDSGADDTVFPTRFAGLIGLSLDQAPTGYARGVGGAILPCRYATVELRLSDGAEVFQWRTLVAFSDQVTLALLGHVGFFDFFVVTFHGAAKEVVIVPDATFPGQRQGP